MRFSEQELSKFKMTPKPMVRPDDRRRNTGSEWSLTPSRSETARPKGMRLSREEWLEALRLSKLGGYAAPDGNAGLSISEVRHFEPAVRASLKKKLVSPQYKAGVERLLGFLQNEGRGGFTMVQQWTR